MPEDAGKNAPTPWWQTLLVTIASTAVTVLLNKYVGPTGAAVGAASMATAAHLAPSPLQK